VKPAHRGRAATATTARVIRLHDLEIDLRSLRLRALLTEVWEIQGSMSTRTVDVHVQRLRQALGSASGLIETVTGFGYRAAR